MRLRAPVRLNRLRHRWRRLPFHGGLAGIAAVALATLLLAVACGVIAVAVALVY